VRWGRAVDSVPDTTICIASINTARCTELCLRSLHARDAKHSYRVVVGDCGSTDGTLPMLVRMAQCGLVDDIELAPCGRRHAAWIDHWLETCSTPYLVLLDSDVEIRRDGWLSDLHYALRRRRSVFVTVAMEEPRPEPTRPGVTMTARPTVYCMLLDVVQARAVQRSFEEWYDGDVGYDVAAWFFAGVTQARRPFEVMPFSWRPTVHHFEAMSYGRKLPGYRRSQVRRAHRIVVARLLFYRIGGRTGAQVLLVLRPRERLVHLTGIVASCVRCVSSRVAQWVA
jgi:glycosyltransferase involved in cell wall biosynthesis